MSLYLVSLLIAYLLVVSFEYWLDYLNLSHLKKFGHIIPKEFEGQIDQSLLEKTRDYVIENSRFGFITSIFSNIILLLFLFGGILNLYNTWIASMNLPFIFSGVVFFLLISYARTVLSIPFSLYSSFKIEKKHGFNTMTPKVWTTDFIKSLIISIILMVIVTSIGFWIIQKSPYCWWFWVWCFSLLFSIFIMYISPYVLEPLFNKFTLLDNEPLEGGIKELMNRVGIKINRIFKMDASKRTKHTNAYFTGIGRVKRIILYDTLLEKMNHGEILSILAHEAGHWKKKHLLKSLIVAEIIALIALYISYRVLQSDILINIFSIQRDTFFAKVVILGFVGSIVSFPFTPLFNLLSRRHEDEADRYSCAVTGNREDMISSLVKLSKDNLSNLHPHPLYAKFHYSHPPVLERIKRIQSYNMGR